jgi:hypothetical protein
MCTLLPCIGPITKGRGNWIIDNKKKEKKHTYEKTRKPKGTRQEQYPKQPGIILSRVSSSDRQTAEEELGSRVAAYGRASRDQSTKGWEGKDLEGVGPTSAPATDGTDTGIPGLLTASGQGRVLPRVVPGGGRHRRSAKVNKEAAAILPTSYSSDSNHIVSAV